MTDEKDKVNLTEFGNDKNKSEKSKEDPWTSNNKVESAAKNAAESSANSANSSISSSANSVAKSAVKSTVKKSVKSSNDSDTENDKAEKTDEMGGKDGESSNTVKQATTFEQDVLNRLAFAAVNEQRRTRRWGIFFKSVMVLYALGLLFLYMPKSGTDLSIGSHTAMVEISGPIADTAFANANNIIAGLRAAYKDKNTKGVILRINSPGGSPVQAGYINDEIYRLKTKHPDIPIKVVVTDICASAAYYIAVAADDIYANKASIVGSIGVLMDGYGFVDTMKKLGVERRLMTAGEHKGFLDPFTPVKPEDQAHMQGLLNNIHDQFIAVVKKGRGDRLLDHPKMFSGLVWSGEKSVDLGLIDGLGSVGSIAREVIGEEKIVDFTPRSNYLDRFAEKIGVSTAAAFKSMFGEFVVK